MKRKMSGFTLVEISIVLFIISLLILIILPNVGAQRKHANNINEKALQTQLNTQAQLYMDEKNTSNVTIEELKTANYLSKAQYEHIKKKKIEIQTNDTEK